MYREFYGFSEDPFNLTPDPSFLFSPSGYGELKSSIEEAIRDRKGVMVITGEVGTGKTTLINTLLKELNEKIKTAYIFNPKLTFKELLKTVLWELKIPVAGEGTASLVKKLNQFLKEMMDQGENVLIIIDEAQNLTPGVLKELHRLYQKFPPEVNNLQTLLVGQVELESKLKSEELAPFRDRVAFHKKMNLLTLQESKLYIDHRLRFVGSSCDRVFSSEAVEAICEYAKGIPRVINMVCDGALFAGWAASAAPVDAKIVKRVISENEITTEVKPSKKSKAIGKTDKAGKGKAEGENALPSREKENKREEPGSHEKRHGGEREGPLGAEAGIRKHLSFGKEAGIGGNDSPFPRWVDPPRPRPLFKAGILTLLLGSLAVFCWLFWPEIRVSPSLLKEELRTPSWDWGPIDSEEKKNPHPF